MAKYDIYYTLLSQIKCREEDIDNIITEQVDKVQGLLKITSNLNLDTIKRIKIDNI